MPVISSQILNEPELTQLFNIACDAIRCRFAGQPATPPSLGECLPRLREAGASFVTLKVNGELQGCIGTIVAHQPLALDVHDKALASAFQDPRFTPLSKKQLSSLSVEVSVLSLPEVLVVASEQALLGYLATHKVGLILSCRQRRALFLPQVWEQLPNPIDFVRHLKHKAGWSESFWDDEMEVKTFVVDSIEGPFNVESTLS
ncbi:AmmeMemoRadiSam system protein A [Vibrio rotiferianus]|uniref:AmmeMemoRadiSam system protein A n=1 Tax=Vibrio rotiferianus TaxID=190895 RepID=UPI0028955F56|nr:AmmeMemoRadiSam system protein A [Vibrio rotiferianus]CAH1555695.1 AmmeMemoRadiSam system protein A [Vibrio rotiferianus]